MQTLRISETALAREAESHGGKWDQGLEMGFKVQGLELGARILRARGLLVG